MSEIVQASYFGFRPVVQNEPLLADQLANFATDQSSAARNLENYYQNWRERIAPKRLNRRGEPKTLIVQFEAGLYNFDCLNFTANNDVFYPNLGIEIHGAGQYSTIFKATVSNAAQFIGLQGSKNWIETPILKKLYIRGDGVNNPNQVGVFLNPDYNYPLSFGGLTVPHWDRVMVQNFHQEQIWLKGGSTSYLIPVQYGIWDNVRVDGYNPNTAAFKCTGQIGPPFIFRNLECYHVRTTGTRGAYVGLDIRNNIPVSSVDTVSNCLVFSVPHRFTSTDRFRINSNYAGLVTGTDYFVVKLDDYRIRVADTLENAQSNLPSRNTPIVRTLTSSAGTTSVNTSQNAGNSLGGVQIIFDTPTFQLCDVGIEVNKGEVDIRSMHIEETNTAVKIGTSGNVSLTDAHIQNGAYTGAVFDGSGVSTGEITVQGRIYLGGAINKLVESSANYGNVDISNARFTGDYPNLGEGISNKQAGLVQLGVSPSGEVNIRPHCNSEFLLNTSTTTVKFIRDIAAPGKSISFIIWEPNSSEWIQFDSTGHLRLLNKDSNGGLLRVPRGTFITFRATAVFGTWTLQSLEMPHHTLTATRSGRFPGNTIETFNVSCPGARVGDLKPIVSINSVLSAGLILDAEVTADNVVTVKIINVSSSEVDGPVNPTFRVLQQR